MSFNNKLILIKTSDTHSTIVFIKYKNYSMNEVMHSSFYSITNHPK